MKLLNDGGLQHLIDTIKQLFGGTIQSPTIKYEVVMTYEDYQALLESGTADYSGATAYNILSGQEVFQHDDN